MTDYPESVIQWSPATHRRFSKQQRDFVLHLLFVQKITQFMPKDVLVHNLLPFVAGSVTIPILYFSNIPFEWEDEHVQEVLHDIVKDYPSKVTFARIARRRNERSKGFGFLQMFNADASHFLTNSKDFEVENRMICFKEALLMKFV